MNKSKIEWCDYVWNPVWGCLNDCSYCYARKIARRFHKNIFNKAKEDRYPRWLSERSLLSKLKNFKPVFLITNFNKPFPKEPARIFVNSMSDIKFWQTEWMCKVLIKAAQNPQHTFIFLTKFPEVYKEYSFPYNCWLGVTADKNADQGKLRTFWTSAFRAHVKFVSIEPFQESMESIYPFFHITNWVIVGARTNPYRPPEKEWLDDLILHAKNAGNSIFIKNNLKPICKNLIQEFPEVICGKK